eukprot:CAMPEP_0179068150 /NCGR_PEP_ID=MMETSP0796-20121207/29857_1 /TAXON_ID=73915 /ORGANISM="Pyrodinium bahamense, Strain pbaha01" /LENGTH=693 /DNA_ID=CAMNT_0020765203 /DNA_START=15 /DNA_END=2096 /DNA_ORIENTATION=-
MSCKILVDTARRQSDVMLRSSEDSGSPGCVDSSGGFTVVPPPAMRRWSDQGSRPNAPMWHSSDTCQLPRERGKIRRASSIPSFQSVRATVVGAAASLVKPNGGGSSSSSSRPEEHGGGTGEVGMDAMPLRMELQALRGTKRGQTAACSAPRGGVVRHSRKKTHSSFVPHDLVAQALLDEDELPSPAVPPWAGGSHPATLPTCRPQAPPAPPSAEPPPLAEPSRPGLVQEEKVREIFIFRHLSERQCSTLARSMTLITRPRGAVVIREGDQGSELFIIHEGEVRISKNGNFITKLSQPAYFGERALLYEEPRAATVIVASEKATFCMLTKQAFLEILSGEIKNFITYRNKLLDTDLQFSDLEEQRVIGRGGYGIVKLVRHRGSGTRYALKCVTRDGLTDHDRNLVQRERAILQLIDHPFCLKLVRSFKDANCVYFLTELVTGGELLDALDHIGVLDLNQAQFYLGSLIVVFEYIHEKNVVYRDLKPENVLLDQGGFVKLIDFGAARRLDSPSQKCYTLLGTPHFMAAEMVVGNGYGMQADIWALGVCLYEFMVGRLPFDGDKPVAIFKQVASSEPVWVPEDLEPPAADMIRWLLRKDPSERPQTTAPGYKAVREHPFFRGFSFEALINRSVTPPMVPQGEQYSEDLNACRMNEQRGSPAAAVQGHPPDSGEATCQLPWRPATAMEEVDGWDAEF